jgi:hypothetical protein
MKTFIPFIFFILTSWSVEAQSKPIEVELNVYQLGARALEIHREIYNVIYKGIKDNKIQIFENDWGQTPLEYLQDKQHASILLENKDTSYFKDTMYYDKFDYPKAHYRFNQDTFTIKLDKEFNLHNRENKPFMNFDRLSLNFNQLKKLLNFEQLYYLQNFNTNNQILHKDIPVNVFKYLSKINTLLYEESILPNKTLYRNLDLMDSFEYNVKISRGKSEHIQTEIQEQGNKSSYKIKHKTIVTIPIDNFADTGLYHALVFVLKVENECMHELCCYKC